MYHVSELNIAELRPRTPPTSSDRAIEAQNTEFAEQLKVRGEAPREPDEAERAALVVPKEIGKVPHDIERHHDVKVVQNVAIEIPAGTAFEDVHGQASSRVHPEDGTSRLTDGPASGLNETGCGSFASAVQRGPGGAASGMARAT